MARAKVPSTYYLFRQVNITAMHLSRVVRVCIEQQTHTTVRKRKEQKHCMLKVRDVGSFHRSYVLVQVRLQTQHHAFILYVCSILRKQASTKKNGIK